MERMPKDEYIARVANCIPKMIRALRWTVPRRLMGFNLSMFQALVLLSLGESKRGLKMSEIGEETGVNLTTLTQVIDSLEKNALVERSRSPKDRRVCLVHLTREGRRLLRQIEDHRNKVVTKVIESLDPDEVDHLVCAFEKATSILLDQAEKLRLANKSRSKI